MLHIQKTIYFIPNIQKTHKIHLYSFDLTQFPQMELSIKKHPDPQVRGAIYNRPRDRTRVHVLPYIFSKANMQLNTNRDS